MGGVITAGPVLLDVDGPVATITFNRPEKLNAADLAQSHALEAAVAAVGAEPEVRVVLLRGAGRSFGTGIDRDMVGDGVPADFMPSHERAYAALEDMDKLVIAVIHGHALGAGLLAALAADLRICSTDAVLGLLAARYGLFPALGTFRLPRLIGLGPARRLILSGDTVDPEEAYRLGLVDHLVPAERFAEGVDELVARYTALSPAAAAAIKHLTGRAFDTPRDAALAEAVPLLQQCLAAPDVATASAVWRARPVRPHQGLAPGLSGAARAGSAAASLPQPRVRHRVDQRQPRGLDDVAVHADRRPRAVAVGRLHQHPGDGVRPARLPRALGREQADLEVRQLDVARATAAAG